LKYAGKMSTYEAELPIQQKGAYETTVTAFDAATGNTGLDRTNFLVESPSPSGGGPWGDAPRGVSDPPGIRPLTGPR